MIKIITFSVFFSILLISCSNNHVISQDAHSQMIASSHLSPVIYLTSNEFDQWIATKKQLLLSDRKQQIESYFIEEYLYRNKNILGQDFLDKVYFLNNASLYSQSISTVKKQVMEDVRVDKNEIQENIHMIQQRNKLKTDKVRLYQIYKKYPVNASTEEKQIVVNKMRLLRGNITDLNSFKNLASVESDSQTRLHNGLLGNVSNGKFKGEINVLVMKMRANELSEVIKGTQGVLLFYCEQRIPPKIRTLKQTSDYVIKILKNRNFTIDYKNKLEQTLQKLEIKFDWPKIYENSPNKTVIVSKDQILTNVGLAWLLPKKDRDEISKKTIESSVKNFLVNRDFYNELKNDQQQKLSKLSHNRLKQSIASSVLAQMVSNQLKIPTDNDIKKHYQENKDLYISQSHYDISAIAFKLTDDNKVSIYNQAEKVLNQLQHKLMSFEEASKKYSFLNEKYNNGYLGKFTKHQVPSAIGINALKQISTMKVGEISKLVETDSSILWIFKLNAIELPRIQSYNEVKTHIDNQLGNARVKELEYQIIENIIAELNIHFG